MVSCSLKAGTSAGRFPSCGVTANSAAGKAWLLTMAALVFPAANAAGAVELIGYLPYYRMGGSYPANTMPAQLALLDEVRYFGLTAASNGTIATLDGASLASHTNRINTIRNAIAALPAENRPRLNITFGGAEEAASFATIAASSSLRSTFAQNIASLLESTGATSVDIDWEHPVGTTQFNNYASMLQRIKQEVGPSRVYATIDPTIAVPTSVLSGPNAIDGISLMTYELGWWANDLNDFNRGEHSLPEYAEDSVDAWTLPPGSPNQRPYVFGPGRWGHDAPEDKLGIGLPFFGRAIGTPQSPKAGTAYTYSQLVGNGTTEDGNYYTFAGEPVWIAGPELAAQRVEFAHDRGLQHVIIWEIAQDLHPSDPDSLLRAAYEAQQSFVGVDGDYNDDGTVDAADYVVWRKNAGTMNPLPNDPHGHVIGSEQYGTWLANYGTTSPSGGGGAPAVPEPGTVSLVAIVGLFCLAYRQTAFGYASTFAD